jgi:hypothetical protein
MTPAMRLEAPPPEPSDQTADLKPRFRGAPSGIPANNHQRAARFSLLARRGTDFSASASSPIRARPGDFRFACSRTESSSRRGAARGRPDGRKFVEGEVS